MTAGFLGIFFFDYVTGLSVGFSLLLGLFSVLSLVEFFRLLSKAKTRASARLPVFFGLLCIFSKWVIKDLKPPEWLAEPRFLQRLNPSPFVFFLFFLTLFLKNLWKGLGKERLEEIATSLFGFIYVVFFLGFLHDLRNMEVASLRAFGLRASLLVVLVAKIGDIGAYFIGSALGRHKLYFEVSPNKTVEGALAGLLCSVLASLSLSAFLGLNGIFPPLFCVLMGFLVGGFAQLGDLLESLFKRLGQVKDSGRLLPAFGGSLDIVDCLILAGPAGYFSMNFYIFFFLKA